MMVQNTIRFYCNILLSDSVSFCKFLCVHVCVCVFPGALVLLGSVFENLSDFPPRMLCPSQFNPIFLWCTVIKSQLPKYVALFIFGWLFLGCVDLLYKVNLVNFCHCCCASAPFDFWMNTALALWSNCVLCLYLLQQAMCITPASTFILLWQGDTQIAQHLLSLFSICGFTVHLFLCEVNVTASSWSLFS